MFVDVLKVYFLNIRYFFIAKKQQLVLYSKNPRIRTPILAVQADLVLI